MIKMRLEANDYEVVTAYDGEEGLAKAAAEKPHLILPDVMTPKMDGFAVLKRLQRLELTKNIPVVMLTAKGESKSVFQSQQLGAADHLIQPCESAELLSVVARHA